MNRNLVAGLFACLFVCGCGTLHNIHPQGAPATGETRVYGGVREDLRAAKDSFQGVVRAKGLTDFAGNAGMGAFCVLDLPLSAIGDTVTLPIAIKRASEQ